MDEMRKELELLVNATQTDLKRAQEKYSIVSALCAQLIEKLDNIIENNKNTDNSFILNILKFRHEINDYPMGEQCQVAFKLGQQAVATATLQKFDEINLLVKEQQKIESIAQKIESGEIDPNAKRHGGQRPESLRTIRAANQKLKQS